MSGKTILWAAVIAFLIFALVRVFKVDTSNPSAVLERYLSHWESNNTTGMYPLLSQRAKAELQRQKVNNVTDYYAYFTDRRADLTGFQLLNHELHENNSRYWVNLRTLDYAGREVKQDATFYLVREADGWRVDSWQSSGAVNLP